jgi:hypothetical protein
MGRYPAEDVCIVVLANNYIPLATQLGSDIAAILFGERYFSPGPSSAEPDPQAVKEVAGRYRFDSSFYQPNMVMTIREMDGRLLLDWGELIPEAPLQYVDRAYWQELRFVKDSTGRVARLEYSGFTAQRIFR